MRGCIYCSNNLVGCLVVQCCGSVLDCRRRIIIGVLVKEQGCGLERGIEFSLVLLMMETLGTVLNQEEA